MSRTPLPAGTGPDARSPVAGPATDPAAVGLAAYAAAAMGVCPYLAPSVRAGQTWWTRHHVADGAPAADVECALFGLGAWAAERTRERIATGDRWACEVVAVQWRGSNPARPAAVLDWPHWALKHAFTPVGVLTGKFTARADPGPDAPPLLLLVTRAAVPGKDRRLLRRTPQLADRVATVRDEGQDVWAGVPGITAQADAGRRWALVRAWAAAQTGPVTAGEDTHAA